MKIKFYWFALLASAALIAQAQAGGFHGGGGGGGRGGGGGFAARGSGGPSFHSMPMGSFGGGRMMYSGQRFSSAGVRAPRSMEFRPQYVGSNAGRSIASGQVTRGNINRTDRFARSSNGANVQREGNRAGQVRSGNNLPANWHNHVFAQRSAGWHRDWNRNGEHWWHGHRCRFVNGSWFIFDFGFDPWWPYWWYPYDYYGYGYYPYGYGYGANVYDNGDYYDQGSYADQYSDSTVAAAQERLAQQGYYRGQVDGVFGGETRRAVARYQTNHGLRVTGSLTTDTLQALGVRRVASNG